MVVPVPSTPTDPPSVPMTLIAPSFSKYWVPPAAAPVTVQLVFAVDWAAKLLVALTKISPWLTSVSEVVNALPTSSIVQMLLPVPVA